MSRAGQVGMDAKFVWLLVLGTVGALLAGTFVQTMINAKYIPPITGIVLASAFIGFVVPIIIPFVIGVRGYKHLKLRQR